MPDVTQQTGSCLKWSEKRHRLVFRFGEVTLFSVVLPLLVCKSHFMRFREADPLRYLPPLPDGCLGYLIHSAPAATRPPRLHREKGFLHYAQKTYLRRYVQLGMGAKGYTEKFSAKTRSTLRRKVRKFAEENGGALQVRVYRSPAELQEFYSLARTLSAQTYQERLLDAGLPDTERFHETMLDAAARGEVRAFLLFYRGQPAAYIYAPVVERALLYQYVGFDPALKALSPGTVLQWQALMELFEEGEFEYFDFTEGDGPHKALFATDSESVVDLMILKPGVWTLLLTSAHALLDVLSDSAAAVLDRLGLKKRIKQAVRAFAVHGSRRVGG